MHYKLILAVLCVGSIEIFNTMLHISTYALAISIGEDHFLIDIFGLPEYQFLLNLTVADLLSALLGFGAVVTPIGVWHWFLDNQQEIFEDHQRFFANPMNKVIAIMFGVIYVCVIASEFATLLLRVLESLDTGPIASTEEAGTGFLPMMILSFTVIVLNFGLGFAVASLIKNFQSEEEI
jgi:hypothetical protein